MTGGDTNCVNRLNSTRNFDGIMPPTLKTNLGVVNSTSTNNNNMNSTNTNFRTGRGGGGGPISQQQHRSEDPSASSLSRSHRATNNNLTPTSLTERLSSSKTTFSQTPLLSPPPINSGPNVLKDLFFYKK